MVPWDLILFALVAGGALSGWVLAELELREAHHDLDEMQHQLDVALGWNQPQTRAADAAHPTLHVVDGDDR